MLDINLFRNDLPAVAAGLAKRGVTLDTARFEALEARAQGHPDAHAGRCRRSATRCRSRSASPRRKGEDAAPLLAEVAGIGDEVEAPRRRARRACRRALRDFLLDLPNLTHASTPDGKSADDNVEVRRWGTPPAFDFQAEGPHRHRRGPRPARLRDGGEALRRALLVPARRPRAPAPRARAVHARHAHARARLHRVLHAVHRQRGDAGRHDAAAEVRGRHVRGEEGRRGRRGRAALPHLDVRDHADELGARRDPRPPRRCRSGSPRTRRASAPRPGATARTRAA